MMSPRCGCGFRNRCDEYERNDSLHERVEFRCVPNDAGVPRKLARGQLDRLEVLAALEFVAEAELAGGAEVEARVVRWVAEDDGPAVVGSFAGQQAGANEAGADSFTAMLLQHGKRA